MAVVSLDIDWTWTEHGMWYTDNYINEVIVQHVKGVMKQDTTLETEQDKEEDKMIIRPNDRSTA